MPLMYESAISAESKMRSPDRILKLEIIDNKKPMSSIGMVDNRLFKDGDNANRLHIVMDTQTGLWSIKYDKGAVPLPLSGQYTGFRQARQHAEQYFLQRNIRIVEVLD